MSEAHDPSTEYNARMQAELEKIQRYRESVEQEFETAQKNMQVQEERAKRIFIDNIEDVANALVNIAVGRHADATPGTMVKAATYIYDRVIINDDDPRKSEMETLLDKLSKEPTPAEPDRNRPIAKADKPPTN